jgi:N-methylhydantoinase B
MNQIVKSARLTGNVDPITLEIVRGALELAAEQINARIVRSATSIVVKEMEDCSAAVFDGRGRLLSESASVPIHLNAIGLCLRTILDHYIKLSDWKPGDVVLTNDPYAGGGSLSSHHTNDVIAYTPIFWRDQLVAFAALTVHHLDIGGTWMGTKGWNVEIEQEGLRLPPIKIVREGVVDQQIVDIMILNNRMPANMAGDLKAQIASITLAQDDIVRMFERYGNDTMLACFEALIDYSERRTREEISGFADGVYTHEELILEDGAQGGPYRLCLKLTVDGDELELDFTGTDPQVKGPINAPLSATYAATFYVMRCLTDSTIPNTEGSKRPIRIVAPRGSLVNCQWPAATHQRMVVCHSLVDLIMGAMAQSVPQRVMADSCGCHYNEVFATDLTTGKRVTFGEVSPGGLGATASKDGANGLSCHVTNCPIPPLEAVEIENPVLFLRRELVTDSGGAGRFRGGLGVELTYRILTPNPQLHRTSQKFARPPQGVFGGNPGTLATWLINPGTGGERGVPNSIGDVEPLEEGDVVLNRTPGGGGYGDPGERPLDEVIADVLEGFISSEAALRDYGVKVDPADPGAATRISR